MSESVNVEHQEENKTKQNKNWCHGRDKERHTDTDTDIADCCTNSYCEEKAISDKSRKIKYRTK